MSQAYESRLNVILSQLLEQQGIVSRSEFIGKGRQDVVVYHQGLAIVLEGSYDRLDAEKDARKRIEQLSADVGIAVHYPSVFPQELTDAQIKEKLRHTSLAIRVIVPEDISGSLFRILYDKNVIAKAVDDWHEFPLSVLTTLVQEIVQFVISEESIVKAELEVSDLIQTFVNQLSFHRQSDTIGAFFGVKKPGFRTKPAGLSEESRPLFRTKSATPLGRALDKLEGIESPQEVVHAEQEIVHAQDQRSSTTEIRLRYQRAGDITQLPNIPEHGSRLSQESDRCWAEAE